MPKYFYNYFGKKYLRQRLSDGIVEIKIKNKWKKVENFRTIIEMQKIRNIIN